VPAARGLTAVRGGLGRLVAPDRSRRGRSRRLSGRAGLQCRERERAAGGAELDWGGPRWCGNLREAVREGGDGVAVAFEGFAFVVGEVELFERLLDAVSGLEELAFGGVFGDVERAACAGEAVGAAGEEVVAAVAVAPRS
jgi:hypothetical protein